MNNNRAIGKKTDAIDPWCRARVVLEHADAARGVSGRDESRGAVESLVGANSAVLPKGRGRPGRQPDALGTMRRTHVLQQWVALSDPAMEGALYNSAPMRRFAQLSGHDAIPDETTRLHFRRLLETHQLAEQRFSQVNAHLASKGLRLRGETIVDAMLIATQSSTTNRSGQHDA